MRAFLSHSSTNKDVVGAVFDALEKDATWLDRAEIEWGDLFLEKIADGIESATDFVLFWSRPAAGSEWVRLEINMAFILRLRQKAIRLRVVVLDDPPLPLYLQPFHSFSVVGSKEQAKQIVQKLSPLLHEPVRSARARFLDRHHEIGRIEQAVDDPETSGIWLFGFTGVGRGSLVQEALRRVFEGADSVKVEVTEGTGFVELALALNAARKESLPEALSRQEIENQIRLSLETFAKEGRLLVLLNVQHWLSEDNEPIGPLPPILNTVRGVRAFVGHPVFLTSTRRPHLEPLAAARTVLIPVKGLDDEHVSALVRNWYFSIYGRELPKQDADKIAPKLFGHPVAARLVAGLLGDHTADYLERYPRELISLRRDLARILLQDLKLGAHAERLMETLALAGVGLPASVIASSGFADAEFQQAVEQCTQAGLIYADTRLYGHPLFEEFFWHRLHRSDYQQRAGQLAKTLKVHLASLTPESLECAETLPVAFRLFALSGDLAAAIGLRKDLSGELEAAAINLYNRRNYEQADKYVTHVLEGDPSNWRMRLYRGRIRVRQEQWDEADAIVSSLLKDRPGDNGALHLKGWRFLRQGRPQDALDVFSGIIAKREHVASLRDAAECLHRLRRNPEALVFLDRAKARESENPFVLDLESRILEEMDRLEPAYESALLASARDPLNGHLHHRLGQIRNKQGKPELAIPHFQKAIELDSDEFTPAHSLASAYLDTNNAPEAENMLHDLVAKARTPANHDLLEHMKARIALSKNDPLTSQRILKEQIAKQRNVVPNLGLFAKAEMALFDQNIDEFPTIAAVALNSAEQALARITELDPSNKFIEPLKAAVDQRRLRKSGQTHLRK